MSLGIYIYSKYFILIRTSYVQRRFFADNIVEVSEKEKDWINESNLSI